MLNLISLEFWIENNSARAITPLNPVQQTNSVSLPELAPCQHQQNAEQFNQSNTSTSCPNREFIYYIEIS